MVVIPAELLLAAHERRCAPVHWCLCVFCTCMHEICFHLCFESWSGRTSQRLQGCDSDIRATCTAPMNKSIKVSLCFTESHLQGSTEHTVIILMEHNYAIIIMFVPQYENTSATQHEHNQYLITKKLRLYISTSSSCVLSFLHLSPCTCTSDPLCATVCYCCCFTVICINSVMNRI